MRLLNAELRWIDQYTHPTRDEPRLIKIGQLTRVLQALDAKRRDYDDQIVPKRWQDYLPAPDPQYGWECAQAHINDKKEAKQRADAQKQYYLNKLKTNGVK